MSQPSPWASCPSLEIDDSLPISERYAVHRDVLQATADDLLQAVKKEILGMAPMALRLAHLVNWRTGGKYWRETRAFASLTGEDWRMAMLAGMAYELMIWACSTAAIPTPTGPVLARNMDFWPEHELARNTYRIERRHGSELRSIIAGWPGAIGVVTALSARGFAIALNAVWSSEGMRKTGYPVMLFLRKVIDEARDYEQAVRMLSQQKLMAACLLTVVGRRNEERVSIERTPSRAKLRKPRPEETLVTTNHFRTDVDAGAGVSNELTETSCGRYDALLEYCQMAKERTLNDELLLYGLSAPDIIQGITAQHVIARPADQYLAVYTPTHLLKAKPEHS